MFKTAEQPKIINNYLENHHKNCYFRIGKNNGKFSQIRVGRMTHTCRPPSVTSHTEDFDKNDSQFEINSSHSHSISPNKEKNSDKGQ